MASRFKMKSEFPNHSVLPVDELVPYAQNARTHTDHQVDQIVKSISEFGFLNPIIIDADKGIVAGHGRVLAAKKLGLKELPVIEAKHLTDAQKKAYVIADNQLALNAGWDTTVLSSELEELKELNFDVALLGFDEKEIAKLLEPQQVEGLTDENEVPEVSKTSVTVPGDLWLLGAHRLMCGDSTSIDAVEKLMNGKKAALLHADPPYGMGKENDGIANDNLYHDKLDQFQMEWWATFRIFLEDNASAYIWGNAEDLWRLWYSGGLRDSERLTFRNEIVWNKYDKSTCKPTVIEMMRSFVNYTERALFFMLGEQGFNNNADNYWEGWGPIRGYLKSELAKVGDIKWAKRAAGHSIKSGCHWFDASQWSMPTEKVYKAWQAEAKGDAFKREYDDLKREYDDLKQEFYATRAFFDNTHDNMTDVWEFSRVTGEDRHGHATPKPVDMMERVMRSSLPEDGICVEPFGGSGSTLIGAEKANRVCYVMELQPQYVDVIIKRWENFTGKQAVLEKTGQTFDQLSNEKR